MPHGVLAHHGFNTYRGKLWLGCLPKGKDAAAYLALPEALAAAGMQTVLPRGQCAQITANASQCMLPDQALHMQRLEDNMPRFKLAVRCIVNLKTLWSHSLVQQHGQQSASSLS